MICEFTNSSGHIGIVAGTAEGAALCYRILCTEMESSYNCIHPEVSLHTFPLRSYLSAVDRNDWIHVAALMSQSAAKLARAGATLIICPNNTLHLSYPFVTTPAPWLHIAQVVAAEAARRGFRRVGVLGTRTIMASSLYPDYLGKWGIECATPDWADQTRIHDIIMNELIPGRFTARSQVFLHDVLERFHTSGYDAAILGCTELPLIVIPETAPLPLLDSTRLLAQASLARILGPRAIQGQDRSRVRQNEGCMHVVDSANSL
ncbi:aspartate/glutamate racemase [Nitrospira sp. KM1]|uniref:aspartate/glutamate racemase family protein n=1 Tax=Nitrospira sp. KM1 TaxID=1936990 RepID=UPI0013A75F9A|nr:amino acid racemase [Nitrospira sp. KM1]BCA53011.1 aspartate/glutamate racemase [Nitrospira sp. KM1]